MTMFWMGLVCGLWVGAPMGFVLAAILIAGKNADRLEDQ